MVNVDWKRNALNVTDATIDDPVKLHAIERELLRANWALKGEKTPVGIQTIVVLAMQDGTKIQAEAAIDILKKYDIIGSATTAKGGVPVLRVMNNGPYRDADYLQALRYLANPDSWQVNNARGRSTICLSLQGMSIEQATYTERLLNKWGIVFHILANQPPQKTMSLRIGGKNIDRLQTKIASLRKASFRPKSPRATVRREKRHGRT